MERNDYIIFFERYLKNEHTAKEHEQFIKWFHSLSAADAEQIMEEYPGMGSIWAVSESSNKHDALIRNLESRLDHVDQSNRNTGRPVLQLWTYLRRLAAAVVIVLIGFGGYYVLTEHNNLSGTIFKHAEDSPAVINGNKAILTLEDGSKINLHEAVKGQIAKQSDIQIYKVTEGQLVYSKENNQAPADNDKNFNQINTPKSGQYQVSLSDGTKVWLNSLSSIRFPTIFSGSERRVEITGEVYFEVASFELNKQKIPFVVVCSNQFIEVLGTHFNVNAYKDETAVRTTLLEGSVKVYPAVTNTVRIVNAVKLRPGEQAILSQKDSNEPVISVTKADTEIAIAWQKGYFKFQDTSIEEVMRQLSRWYDLEIVYNGPPPQDQFTGYVAKNIPLSNVLKILEGGGGVKFNASKNKIEVTAKE